MYTPPYFAETRQPILHSLMRMHPFATLVAASPHGIDAMHVPLLLVEPGQAGESAGVLQGHMARVNPFWKNLEDGSDILAIFQGTNRYISPNWYPSKLANSKVVPTWNYAVVHARGKVSWKHDAGWLRSHLEHSTDTHESGERPWQVSDAPDDYIERMLKAIVGFEIAISDLQGKWKLSQNRSEEDRLGVIAGLENQSHSHALEMQNWMQKHEKGERKP